METLSFSRQAGRVKGDPVFANNGCNDCFVLSECLPTNTPSCYSSPSPETCPRPWEIVSWETVERRWGTPDFQEALEVEFNRQ